MSNYSFVKRANFSTKQKMTELIASLNDNESAGVEKYSLESCHYGYNVVLSYDDGAEKWTDKAAVVRCSFCGEVRELFDGQIEFCYHCGKDW